MCENNDPYPSWLRVGLVDQEKPGKVEKEKKNQKLNYFWYLTTIFFSSFLSLESGRILGKKERFLCIFNFFIYGETAELIIQKIKWISFGQKYLAIKHCGLLMRETKKVNEKYWSTRPTHNHHCYRTCCPSVSPSPLFISSETKQRKQCSLLACGSGRVDHWWHLSCLQYCFRSKYFQEQKIFMFMSNQKALQKKLRGQTTTFSP